MKRKTYLTCGCRTCNRAMRRSWGNGMTLKKLANRLVRRAADKNIRVAMKRENNDSDEIPMVGLGYPG
jgi:hypothetical protein